MNEKDVALFQHAEQLANNGQKLDAYSFFRGLQERNPEQVEILFWIVATTSNAAEAQYAIDTIKRLQPNHPRLGELEAFHQRKLQPPPAPMMPMGSVLRCPYCGNWGPALVRSKMSTAGVVVLVLLLIFTVIFFWIGLLITEKYYAYARCGSRIATAIWSEVQQCLWSSSARDMTFTCNVVETAFDMLEQKVEDGNVLTEFAEVYNVT